MVNGYECYCGRAWMSVTPPPPCPWHTRPNIMRVTDPGSVRIFTLCRGRHCAHDAACKGVAFNG